MEIVSFGRLPSAFLLWQSRPGTWGLTIACKATFYLVPGEATLATEQEPINEEDNHWDDNVARSVHSPCDLVPFKPFVDVVLVGSAFAPSHSPVRSLTASLAVGDMHKSIEVFCDRAMMPDGSIQEGSGFARMPLLYERAAGGTGTWNPVGVRADARDAYGRTILPNLQKPGVRPTTAAPLEPVGFGPIAPQWPTRLDKLGRSAPGVSPYMFRDKPLPQGMDPSHFNAAPLDQQLAAIREGDSIILDNLHPDHPKIRTDIPALRPAVFVRAPDRAPQRLSLRPDTLWIDTDQKIFSITWRGQLALSRREEWTQAVTATETGGKTMTWAELEPYLKTARGTFSEGRKPESSPESTTPSAAAGAPATKREAAAEDKVKLPGKHHVTLTAVLAPAPPLGAEDSATGVYDTSHLKSEVLPFTSAPRSPAAAGQPSPAESRAARSDSALPFTPKPAPLAPESPWATGMAPAGAPQAPAVAPPAPAVVPPAPAMAPPAPAVVPPAPAVAPPTPAVAPPAPASTPAMASSTTPPSSESGSPAGVALSAGGGAAFSGTGGVIAASNIAAAAQPWLSPSASKSTPAAQPSPGMPLPRASFRTEPPDVIQLIWYHEPSVARFRRFSEWKPILKELERKPRDKDLDDPALAQDPMEMEERREVFEILTHGAPKAYEAIQQAHLDAIREDGKFVPPLVLVMGEIGFPFDELETLKATVTTVSPLVTPADENLRVSLDNAKEFLKTPGLSSAPAVSEGLTTRIKDAFKQGRRSVPPDYVDTQAERVLLEQRHYQKRALLGEKHLRALLPMTGSIAPLPAYIPEAVSEKLPMYQRFRARLIAEMHPQEDQHESHSLALKVLALSRLTPPPKR